jgi:hypothetical protein
MFSREKLKLKLKVTVGKFMFSTIFLTIGSISGGAGGI